MERNWLYTRETPTEEESEEEGFLSFRNNIAGGDMDDETDAQIHYLLRNRYINLVSWSMRMDTSGDIVPKNGATKARGWTVLTRYHGWGCSKVTA